MCLTTLARVGHCILRFFFLISKQNTVDSVSGDGERNKDNRDGEGESERQRKTENLHQLWHGFEEAGKSRSLYCLDPK